MADEGSAHEGTRLKRTRSEVESTESDPKIVKDGNESDDDEITPTDRAACAAGLPPAKLALEEKHHFGEYIKSRKNGLAEYLEARCDRNPGCTLLHVRGFGIRTVMKYSNACNHYTLLFRGHRICGN